MDKIAQRCGDGERKVCRADKFKQIVQQPSSSNAYYETEEKSMNLERGILE